jgi:hypothetical protein
MPAKVVTVLPALNCKIAAEEHKENIDPIPV